MCDRYVLALNYRQKQEGAEKSGAGAELAPDVRIFIIPVCFCFEILWKDCTIPHQIDHLEFRVNHIEINTPKRSIEDAEMYIRCPSTCLHVGTSEL